MKIQNANIIVEISNYLFNR